MDAHDYLEELKKFVGNMDNDTEKYFTDEIAPYLLSCNDIELVKEDERITFKCTNEKYLDMEFYIDDFKNLKALEERFIVNDVRQTLIYGTGESWHLKKNDDFHP